MEHSKLTLSEMRAFDAKRLKEVERETRHSMAIIRAESHLDKGKNLSKLKKLKVNLARLLTVGQENERK